MTCIAVTVIHAEGVIKNKYNNTSNNCELFSSTRTKVRVDDVIEVERVDSLPNIYLCFAIDIDIGLLIQRIFAQTVFNIPYKCSRAIAVYFFFLLDKV